MTADERLNRIQAKLGRAKRHLSDLEIEVRTFLASHPYEIAARRDARTREVVYYATRVDDVPLTIAVITADVLQNLRKSLDHLACELVFVAGSSPTRNSGFPIFGSAAIYKAQAPEKVQGMRKNAVDVIDAIKPYKGGNDTLWRLHGLGNIDKHRLLMTVGLAYRFQSVTPKVLAYLSKAWSGRAGAWPTPEAAPSSLIEYERRHSPLSVGDVLFIDTLDGELNEQSEFSFDVAFGEGKIASGLLLLETLKQMVDTVDNVICEFGPLLT